MVGLRTWPKKASSGGTKQVTRAAAVAVRFLEWRAWAKSVKPEDEREVSMASEQTAWVAGVFAAKKARRSGINMAGNLRGRERLEDLDKV